MELEMIQIQMRRKGGKRKEEKNEVGGKGERREKTEKGREK